MTEAPDTDPDDVEIIETADTDPHGYETIETADTVWHVDRSFVTSTWTCIWGRGCLGILADPAPELNQGCCSVGAHLDLSLIHI